MARNPSRNPVRSLGHYAFRHALNAGRSQVVGAGRIDDKQPPSEVRDRLLGDYALVYLREGGGFYRDATNGERAVRAGDVLVIFPDAAHSYGRGDQPLWSEAWLIFNGPLFRALEGEGLLDRARPVLSPGLHADLLAAFEALHRDLVAVDDNGHAALAARVHLLITQIVARDRAAQHDGGEDRIATACARLSERLDGAIDIARLARSLDFSYERFRKIFAETVGVPPARYRLLRRIDLAKELLADGRLAQPDIATRCGFCDVFHFARQFKAVVGMPPGAFRAQFH